MRHLIIHCQPVRCDLDLGLFQIYRPGAYLAVQVVFDEIFLMKAWRRARLMYLLLSTGVFSSLSLIESSSSTLLPRRKEPSSQVSSINARASPSPLVYANVRLAPRLLSYHTRNLEAQRHFLLDRSAVQTQNHTALLSTILLSLYLSYSQISNNVWDAICLVSHPIACAFVGDCALPMIALPSPLSAVHFYVLSTQDVPHTPFSNWWRAFASHWGLLAFASVTQRVFSYFGECVLIHSGALHVHPVIRDDLYMTVLLSAIVALFAQGRYTLSSELAKRVTYLQ